MDYSPEDGADKGGEANDATPAPEHQLPADEEPVDNNNGQVDQANNNESDADDGGFF